eukprot:gene12500-6248_t
MHGSIEKLFYQQNFIYHVFDGHDKAFDIWMKELDHKKHKKLTLVHIDSHSDLQITQNLTKKTMETETAESIRKWVDIEIQNFISPFLISGMIERVIWIVPTFDTIYKPYSATFEIGFDKSRNITYTNSDHFMYSSKKNLPLTDTTTVHLDIISLKGEESLKRMNIIPEETLLNIDLDYFSVSSPQYRGMTETMQISKKKVLRLASIFDPKNYCFNDDSFTKLLGRFEFKSRDKASIIYGNMQLLADFYIMRLLVDDLDEVEIYRKSRALKDYWCSKENDFYSIMKELIDLRDVFEEDEEFYEDFFIIMISPLHLSSYNELIKSKTLLKKFLLKNGFSSKNLPLVTTIAKSVADGHTPPRQVNFILNSVVDLMYEMFIPN